jgi:hypothetical protein
MVRCRAVKITCGCRYRDSHQPPLAVDCSHAQGAAQRIGDDADDLDPVVPSPVKLSIVDILPNAEAKPGQPSAAARCNYHGSVRLEKARPLSAAGVSPPVQIITPSLS